MTGVANIWGAKGLTDVLSMLQGPHFKVGMAKV